MAALEDKRNSPFNSFLIDDPTPNNHRITITSEESPTICVICQEELRSRSSKLLACLHSVCVPCLEKIRDPTGTLYSCQACQYKSRIDTICDNLYASEESTSNGLTRHCSNCEEGNLADWFCDNCADWLCLQCKTAHARVRLTKDHVVTQKNNEQAREIRGVSTHTEKLLCQVHNEELARNFCQDCQTLTCDECQINQHKNHRYSFIDEAVQSQKTHLHSLVTKIRDVRLMLNKIQQTRNQQRSEIDQTERQVIDDIKLFGLNMITEISRTCKLLIHDTTSLCNQARSQFTEKNTRFEQYLQNIDHSLDFVNDALTAGSKMALLTSNRVMSKRLDHLLHQNALWSKAINPFQLSFVPNDSKTVRASVTNLGVLMQNGKKRFHQQKSFVAQGVEQNHEGERGKVMRSTSQMMTTAGGKNDNEHQSGIVLDTSDDYCAVCRCGGDLVCCDECPRVYHVECHVPSLNEVVMNDKWKCGICMGIDTSTSNGKRKYDEIDESSSSSSTNKTQLNPVEKQICEKLILRMYIHPLSVPFHHPVPADCISYHKIITRPIDLRTIKGKFNSYTNIQEFIADVRLMFQNCATFNRPESEIGKSGRALSKAFDEWLEKYCTEQQIPLPDRSNKRKKTSIQLPDHVS